MLQTLISQLAAVPPQVATLILAAVPVAELRGALPVALTVYKLPLAQAIFWSILGNMIPVYFLLIFFERGSAWLSARSPLAARFIQAMHQRTHHKLHDQVEKYGPWALALFVAVPLPVTGAWTGSLAAFVFDLPRKKAFLAILIGVCIASIIVSALTLGAVYTVNSVRAG